MKNADYWRGRFGILEDAANSEGAEYLQTIESEFRRASQSVQDDIERWYGRFATNNGITLADAKKWLTSGQLAEFKWSVQDYIKAGESLNPQFLKQLENASARVHISRLEALQFQMQQQIELLYGNRVDDLDGLLRKVYSNGYYHTAFELQRGMNLGWDLQSLNPKQLQAVLSRPWSTDMRTFRDRCWTNKTELANTIQTQLTQAIIRGDSPDKITKAIVDRFNVSKNKAGRLAMTESAYFSSQAQKDCFNELDVEQYEIVSALDEHTCEICGGLDGKVFRMPDYEPGVTANPFHPWCRCCTAPYFDDNTGERAARDQEGQVYYVPAEVKFQDWKNTFVVDPELSRELYALKGKKHTLEGQKWDGIWKDPVSVQDYNKKRGAIPAKRDYFEGKLSQSTGDQHNRFQTLIDSLNDFESKGKEWGTIQTQVDDIQERLTEIRTGVKIKDNPYSQSRKDSAYWFSEKQAADDVLREPTGETWKSWTGEQRLAAYQYTAGSGKFNRPLRGYQGGWSTYKGAGNVPLDYEGGEKFIHDLTDALNQSTYDFDIWLQRGVETRGGVARFLGVSESALSESAENLAKEIMGKIITDDAFLSASAAKGGGFSGTVFNVYAPKGTKMVYAEPFSKYGHGAELQWDGMEMQSYFGSEFEVILQRGYEYRVIKVDQSEGRWYFDIEVVLPKGG